MFRFLSLFIFFAALPLMAAGPIALPSGTQSLSELFEDSRAAIRNCLKDLKQTFLLREEAPGMITFFSGTSTRELSVTYRASGDDKNRTEIVKITRNGIVLFQEEIFVSGNKLEAADPLNRIFLEKTKGHDGKPNELELADNETEKRIIWRTGGNEIISINGTRDGNSINYDVFIGGNRWLKISDQVVISQQPLKPDMRELEYGTLSGQYRIPGQDVGYSSRFRDGVSREFGMVLRRSPGDMLADVTYFRDGNEVFGQSQFGQEFFGTVIKPFINGEVQYFYDWMVKHQFPKPKKRADLGAKNQFLDELVVLRTQVEKAKNDQSVLNLISTKILNFINAIQDGTLDAKYR